MAAPVLADGTRASSRNGGVIIPREYWALRDKGLTHAVPQAQGGRN
jgi:hypothetical protein